jgi:hypothetical protein
MVTITINIDKHSKFKFQTACLINGTNMSDILKRTIDQYIKDTEGKEHDN